MEKLVVIAIVALLLAVFAAPVATQCDGVGQNITILNGKSSIKSPNLGDGGTEYNKTANCSWEFNLGSNQALVLTVERLKLYFLVKGEKVCPGSYNLTINGEPMKCDEYVDNTIEAPKPYCKAYYNTPSCQGHQENLNSCNISDQVSSTVPMTYFSDGRTSPQINSSYMYFEIGYEFIQCPKVPATTKDSTTPSPISTAPENFAVSSTNSSFSTSNNGVGEAKGVNSSTIIIIASCAAGGAVILIFIVVAIFCIIKRKRKLVIPGSNSAQDLPLEESCQTDDNTGGNAGQISQSATVVGYSNPSNQSEAPITSATTELYATVSTPPKDTFSADSPAYHVIDSDQSGAAQHEATGATHPGAEGHVTTSGQSEGVLYSTVSIKQKTGKETVHYSKEMVDNVLYGTVDATE